MGLVSTVVIRLTLLVFTISIRLLLSMTGVKVVGMLVVWCISIGLMCLCECIVCVSVPLLVFVTGVLFVGQMLASISMLMADSILVNLLSKLWACAQWRGRKVIIRWSLG